MVVCFSTASLIFSAATVAANAEIHDRTGPEPSIPHPVLERVHRRVAVSLKHRRLQLPTLGPAPVGARRPVPPSAGRNHTAQKTGHPDQLVLAVHVARVASPLLTDLQQPFGLTRDPHHVGRTFDRVRHRRFAIHMKARLQARGRLLGMGEIGRRYEHGIQVILLPEHVTIVDIATGLMTVSVEQANDALEAQVLPDIAHRREANSHVAPHLQAGAQQHLPLGPRAKQGHVEGLFGVVALLCRHSC